MLHLINEAEVAAAIEEAAPPADESSKQEEGEVPLPVAESEPPPEAPSEPPEEVIVQATRHQVIHDLVAEAQTLLRDVELQYVFTGKGKKRLRCAINTRRSVGGPAWPSSAPG